MSDMALLSLLHLCDSLFPTGGFAHSDGLEAATASGQVTSPSDLRDWMDVCLDESLARMDGPVVLRAWHAAVDQRWNVIDVLNAEVHALRPSSGARSASRATGARLLKTWQEIHPGGLAKQPAGGSPMTLPVVFGIICGTAGIEARASVEGFMYTRLAAIASSAMRLMSIGQREAHALLATTLARVPAAVDAIEERVERGDGSGAFAPAVDLATMGQQYVRSRLFLS